MQKIRGSLIVFNYASSTKSYVGCSNYVATKVVTLVGWPSTTGAHHKNCVFELQSKQKRFCRSKRKFLIILCFCIDGELFNRI